LSQEQKTIISGIIDEYRESDLDDKLKIMALGYAYLTIAGEDNFNKVVDKMQGFRKT
jgi:hypothetical protein